jgi:hypothetical protein
MTDKAAGIWPPESRETCDSLDAHGTLRKRGISALTCYEIADTEGRAAATERARSGGYVVRSLGLWDVNSAGGVEPVATFVNPNPDSAIKYIDLQMTMYNQVGDVIRSEIGGHSNGTVRMVGPLVNEQGLHKAQWGPVWYNHSATCLKVISVRVEFMNRKIVTYSGAQLSKALHPSISRSCSPK